jgi:hypothetical protein
LRTRLGMSMRRGELSEGRGRAQVRRGVGNATRAPPVGPGVDEGEVEVDAEYLSDSQDEVDRTHMWRKVHVLVQCLLPRGF